MNTIKTRGNHGRWIADCPKCSSAMATKYLGDVPLFNKFACFDCGCGLSDEFKRLLREAPPSAKCTLFTNEKMFFQIEITYPEEVELIESVLMKRERIENQNWNVGETVNKLEVENSEHGVG